MCAPGVLVWVEPRTVGGRSEVQPDEGHAQRNHSSGGEQDSNSDAVSLIHGLSPVGARRDTRDGRWRIASLIIARHLPYDASHDQHLERQAAPARDDVTTHAPTAR